MAARDKKTQTSTDTVILPIGDMSVTFKKPSPGQVAALRRAGQLFGSSDPATQGQGGMLFLDVLDNLVSDNAILNRLYAGMADNSIELEVYAECALALMRHFAPGELDDAPKNGPVTSTRRRATARPATRR